MFGLGQAEAITEIVSGGAPGVDSMAKFVAEMFGVPLKVFQADWNKFGTKAGPIRNGEMADYADALLLIWDGESRGSRNMLYNMLENKKPVYQVQLLKS